MSGLAKIRTASLEYASPMYEQRWRGSETVPAWGLPKVKAASLEYDERMWRHLTSRDTGGGRHPPGFLVPGDRDLVTVEQAARIMGTDVASIRRLAEVGFLHSRHEGGGLRVEPAIVSERREVMETGS